MKTSLTPEEIKILSKLSVEDLQVLVNFKESGKAFSVMLNLVNLIVDIEKNYAFSLNEDEHLGVKHALSRGKASFGIQFLRLISGAASELGRREKIQKELRQRQEAGHE